MPTSRPGKRPIWLPSSRSSAALLMSDAKASSMDK